MGGGMRDCVVTEGDREADHGNRTAGRQHCAARSPFPELLSHPSIRRSDDGLRGRSARPLAISHPTLPSTTFRVAPRKRRRRSWLDRHRNSHRGRFELGILGGGAIALILAAVLPDHSDSWSLLILMAGGCAMTLVASVTGFVPALAASIFAPLVVALTDPMWTLGTTLADFNLGSESSATFAVFVTATVIGSAYRRWVRRERGRKSNNRWRAVPR